MTLRIRSLFMCLLLSSFVAACGCDAPLADVDGGTDAAGLDATLDAPMRDTGPPDLGDCPDEDGDGSRAAACGGDDCDDADAARYPGGSELCDYAGHDEDCNDATYGTKDDDADGYVDARCCNGTTCGNDCDDTRGGAHPGLPEVCNRRDDDCNGVVDEDAQVAGFTDADGDLYGDGDLPIMACAGTAGISSNSTDCDDSSMSAGRASPAFEEVAGDGIDNDCDGVIDEGGGPAALWYRDSDSDGFGVVGDTMTSSVVLPGYALLAGDCDDADAARSPIAAEICNGFDDNCNGLADFAIGINDWEDDDRDGFVDSACGGAANDCDDRDRLTHPGAAELCDRRDNDCDTMVDEACGVAMDGGVPDGGSDAGVDAGPRTCARFVIPVNQVRGLSLDAYRNTWAGAREATLSGDMPASFGTRCLGGTDHDAYVGTRTIGALLFTDMSGFRGAHVSRLAMRFSASGLPPGAYVTGARLRLPRATEIASGTSLSLQLHVVAFERAASDLACSDFSIVRWGTVSLGRLTDAHLVPTGTTGVIELAPSTFERIEGRVPFELGIRTDYDLDNVVPPDGAQRDLFFVAPGCGIPVDCASEQVEIEVDCMY